MKSKYEMNHRIIGMLQTTWDQIADDVLALNDGESVERAEVIEMVCDADHYATHGGDAEAAQEFCSLLQKNHVLVNSLTRTAFPDEWYGY